MNIQTTPHSPRTNPFSTLIARWDNTKDISIDAPCSVTWGDGTPATLQDFVCHQLDTHEMIAGSDGFEVRMFPCVLADVLFDANVGAWVRKGNGIVPAVLDVTDPNARDEELYAELATFPVVYRPNIIRT